MSSRRRDDCSASFQGDQFDRQVDELHRTVKNMREVSEAIHEELEAHNQILSGLSDRYNAGMDAVGALLTKMKDLYVSTGWSPMMLMMVFTALLVFFLWLYWKVKA
jgi:hypothetical protein